MEQGSSGTEEPENSKMPEEQETQPGVFSTDTTPIRRKTRDPEYYRLIGSKGGKKTKEKYGKEHFQSLAKKGGEATAKTHGTKYFANRGKEGGNTTKERHGTEHFKKIGKQGGKKSRKKRKPASESNDSAGM